MNVLSLFDGMSGAMAALQSPGIKPTNYYACEIDKYSEAVSRFHYPDIIRLGDVRRVSFFGLPKIDLLVAGFPCQSFSFAGQQLNFNDPRGKLFFEVVRLLQELQPKFFILENVIMKKDIEAEINKLVGVKPVVINSALLSAQNRKRNYWVGGYKDGGVYQIDIQQPNNKGILLKDIIEDNIFTNPASIVGRRLNERGVRDDYNKDVPITQCIQVKHNDGKSGCLTTVDKDNVLSSLPPGRYEDVYNKNKDVTNFVDRDKSFCIDANYFKGGNLEQYFNKSRRQLVFGGAMRGRYLDGEGKGLDSIVSRQAGLTEQRIELREDGKSNCLTCVQKDSLCIQVGNAGITNRRRDDAVYSIHGKSPTLMAMSGGQKEPKISTYNVTWRKLTPVECERLQTFPDDYTKYGVNDRGNQIIISNSQRYKMLGNGFTRDVIAHIIQHIPDVDSFKNMSQDLLGWVWLNCYTCKINEESLI